MDVKKRSFDLGGWVLDALAPVIQQIVKQVVEVLFEKFLDTSEMHAKVVMVSLYPVIDVELETLVLTTDTDLDDAVVRGIKAGMETIAKERQIQLPNLDQD